MRILQLVLLLILLLSIKSVHGQNAAYSPFLGKWTGKGALFSYEARFIMNWKEILHDKFVLLEFENQYDRDGTSYSMQAVAIYNFNQNPVSAIWYDSRGKILPIKAEMDKNILTAFWGDENSEKGKTVYVSKGNTIEVSDFVWREGSYQLFGSALYTKH